jgi:membrane protein required for colicin V production
MGIDLFILGLTGLFGLLGALSGASRQLAQLAALVVAAIFTKPIAVFLAPHVTTLLGGPAVLGVVAGYVVAFITLFSLVRWVVTSVLRRMLAAGEEREERGADRSLGFVVGALKVLAIAWVVLSALVFAEEQVKLSGKRLGLSPGDSWAFELARTHNLFAYAQFGPARNFVELGQASVDPERRKALTREPAFKSLQADPRFKQALADPDVKKALETGDWRAALRSDLVMQLVQDEQAVKQIDAALSSLQAP